MHAAVDEKLGDVRPLDDERLTRLRVNCVHLVDLINLKDGLLDEMMSVGCITQQQRDVVREMNSSSAERNRQLLDILKRRSVAHYNLFLTCLRRNAQAFIANILHDGGGKKHNEIKLISATNLILSHPSRHSMVYR